MQSKVGTTINFDLAHGKGCLVTLYGVSDDFERCYSEINQILVKNEEAVVKMMKDFEKFSKKYYDLVEIIKLESNKIKLKQLLLQLDGVFIEILCRYLFFVYLGYGADKLAIKQFLVKYKNQFEKIRNCGIDTHMDKEFPKLFAKYNASLMPYIGLFSRSELIASLNGTLVDLEKVKQRAKAYLLLTNNGQTNEYFLNEINLILEKELARSIEETSSELRGQVANNGISKGKAVVVLTEKDYFKIKSNCILITSMTKPSVVSFLSKVKAIVTDDGGALCHASIISRELKLPCIVGTKRATEIFKDGDLLEVDATNGVVRKI